MGTASIKSRNRSNSYTEKSGRNKPGELPEIIAPRGEISKRTWLIACVAIFVVAAVLRLNHLDLVPLHHDEGVNGNFLVRLVREGYYHYDPANYHGPTLYYFAAFFPWLLRLLSGQHAQNTYGLTTTAIRLVPVVFGLATVGLVFLVRRNLGTLATLVAAGLLAISPGAVYLSRYFIHETLFVFFTFGIVVAGLKYFESASPVYLILAAVSAGLLFATKETAFISAAVLGIAFLTTRAYLFLSPWLNGDSESRNRKARLNGVSEGEPANFVERIGGPTNLIVWMLVALAVFIAVNVLFYSSFFTNFPKGVWDSLETFKVWSRTSKEAHVKPFITYVWWLLLQESPLLVLGAAGAILSVFRPARAFAIFSGLWAFGLIAAYSLVGYKTPWLSLNFLVPLALSSGVAIQWLYEELVRWDVGARAPMAVVVAVLLVAIGPLPGMARAFDKAVSDSSEAGFVQALATTPRKTFIPGYQTIDLNFINYDNDNGYYVYVYAHTHRELLKLVDEVNRIAEATHQGGQTGITMVSPDYWPLPWYFRDYSRVGYHQHIVATTEPIIIAKLDQEEDVKITYGDRYQKVPSGFNPEGSYALRPGVELLLYTRRELLPDR